MCQFYLQILTTAAPNGDTTAQATKDKESANDTENGSDDDDGSGDVENTEDKGEVVWWLECATL